MPSYVIAILLFLFFTSLLAALALIAGRLVGPARQSAVKRMPYESGMDPIHGARRRFDVRFHLVAIVFVLFDVELLFLYPWAVADRHPEGFSRLAQDAGTGAFNTWLVFGEILLFIGLLGLGLVYVWRRGVFRWR